MRARTRATLVPRDRRNPCGRVARQRPAQHGLVRREEHLLRGVLGLDGIAQQ
jgi:hypothetical protein